MSKKGHKCENGQKRPGTKELKSDSIRDLSTTTTVADKVEHQARQDNMFVQQDWLSVATVERNSMLGKCADSPKRYKTWIKHHHRLTKITGTT